MNILDNFKLHEEQEDHDLVSQAINKGVVFRGTNLWVLVFAIFIASLGLNVNSTAVIIGAMLISPLMGPIMGLGFSIAVNDVSLLRKSVYNFLFASGVGLATSSLYFLITPLSDAHSEILARTSPTVYDVLIAFFGGLAGILALNSKNRGNVIPGVAIATALMPPLCTAGYGLASFNFHYFFGAFYLFLINTVFIALATFLMARFLKFPFIDFPLKKDRVRAQRIIWSVVLLTLIPSVYFAYDIVEQTEFKNTAENFIQKEATNSTDYVLKSEVDPDRKTITITYAGSPFTDDERQKLENTLKDYYLPDAKLLILYGLDLHQNVDPMKVEQENQKTILLAETQNRLSVTQFKLDSIQRTDSTANSIFNESCKLFPEIQSMVLENVRTLRRDTTYDQYLCVIKASNKLTNEEEKKVREWLMVRLKTPGIEIIYQ